MCRQTWLKTYENNGGKTFQSVGKEDFFRLGNKTFKTVKTVRIPFDIGVLNEEIYVEVIEANIPIAFVQTQTQRMGS